MSRSRKAKPEKRGRGRPPIDPDGDTVPLTLRISQAHFVELRELIADGRGKTMQDAARQLVEESAARRRAVGPRA